MWPEHTLSDKRENAKRKFWNYQGLEPEGGLASVGSSSQEEESRLEKNPR